LVLAGIGTPGFAVRSGRDASFECCRGGGGIGLSAGAALVGASVTDLSFGASRADRKPASAKVSRTDIRVAPRSARKTAPFDRR